MVKGIKKWLNRPYYWNDSTAFKLKFSLGLGFFLFAFLNVANPFNIQTSISVYLLRFYVSLITVANLFIFFFLITALFPKFFNEEKWTVSKHFITIFSIIFLSSIARWLLVNEFIMDANQNSVSFLKMLKYSFIIAVFPTLVYIYFDEKYHFNKYKTASKELTEEKKEVIINKPKKKSTKKVTIYASNNKESLSFKINTLIYVTSESNYACFFIKEDESTVKEHILRLPLKGVEDQLKEFSEIFRCHKSYLINTSYIDDVSGNARGYYFHLDNPKIDIPVSRSINKKQLQGKIFLSF